MKRKIIRNFTLVIMTVLFIGLTTAQTVFADIIAEPIRKDSFYEEHSSKCKVVYNKYCTTDGKKGYTTVFINPENKGEVKRIKNAAIILVSYTYQDKNNKLWGCVSDEHGWVLMSEVQDVYDQKDFYLEHKKEFQKYKGEFDQYEVKNIIIAYSYPGSGVVTEVIQNLNSSKYIVYTYLDSNHELWGCIKSTINETEGFEVWTRNWICLDHPTSKVLPQINYLPTIIPESGEAVSDSAFGENKVILLTMAISLVILVGITAVLVQIFWKKENKND
jgi:hypothetical protein